MSEAVDLMTAIAALKIKRARFRNTRDGVVISQPGKPDLMLTYAAASEFARGIQEAEADS